MNALFRSLVIGVVALFPAALAPELVCAQGGAPLPIRIGYQTNADWLTIAARNLKLFEKAGLTPAYVKFQAGAPMIAAAESKSVDVTTPGTVPFIAGLAQGVDWVIIGIDTELPPAQGFVARKDAGIKTLADLKGKTIGYFRASTSHYGLVMALRKSNIGLDQVKLLHMTPAQQVAAMINKDIDAAAVWEPWMQRMVYEAKGEILAMESELGIDTALATYAVRRDWLRDNRETARRFLNALRMGWDELQRDRTGVIKSFAEEAAIKEEWARRVYEEAGPPRIRQWADPQYRYSIVKGSVFHRALAELAKFMYEEKIITKPVDVSNAMDPTVIAEVLKK